MILLVTDKRLRHSEVREPQSEGIKGDRLSRRQSSLVSSLFLGPKHYLHSETAPLQGSLSSEGCHGLTEVSQHNSGN